MVSVLGEILSYFKSENINNFYIISEVPRFDTTLGQMKVTRLLLFPMNNVQEIMRSCMHGFKVYEYKRIQTTLGDRNR